MVKFNVHSFKKVQEQQANYKGIKKQHAQKSRSPKSSEWIRIAGESLDVLPRIWISKQVDVEGNEIDYLVQADPDTTKHFDELVSFLGPETFRSKIICPTITRGNQFFIWPSTQPGLNQSERDSHKTGQECIIAAQKEWIRVHYDKTAHIWDSYHLPDSAPKHDEPDWTEHLPNYPDVPLNNPESDLMKKIELAFTGRFIINETNPVVMKARGLS